MAKVLTVRISDVFEQRLRRLVLKRSTDAKRMVSEADVVRSALAKAFVEELGEIDRNDNEEENS